MDRGQYLQAFLAQRQHLHSFILSIVRNREQAEDVFQDVALIAFEKCSLFEPGTDFGAWVREIARRRILKAREMAATRNTFTVVPQSQLIPTASPPPAPAPRPGARLPAASRLPRAAAAHREAAGARAAAPIATTPTATTSP